MAERPGAKRAVKALVGRKAARQLAWFARLGCVQSRIVAASAPCRGVCDAAGLEYVEPLGLIRG